MKIRLITLSLAVITLTANAQSKKKKEKVKETAVVAVDTVRVLSELDSASYSFGLKIAMGLKSDGVKSLNYELLSKAMADVFSDQKLLISDEQAGPAINTFLKKISEAKFAGAKEESAKFLEENNIAILYVSVDTNRLSEKYINDIKGFNLEGYHYYATPKMIPSFEKTLNTDRFAVPKYALFNKQGKLVLNNTKRPSEGKATITQIKEILNNEF